MQSQSSGGMTRLRFSTFISATALLLVVVDAKVCPSMTVSFQPEILEKLRNCTIIMGHLKVEITETIQNATDYDEYVFPELIEVEDYVLFCNVQHLTSIGKMFPNLKVIRGNKLHLDRALAVMWMEGLEEVGLTNLQYIGRGAVDIRSCPKVCYVDTINWKRIGADVVRTDEMSEKNTCENQHCPRECDGFCWNATHCQKRFDQISCHPQCIGCTKENSPKHCNICRNYEDHGECVETCPPSKYANEYSMKCLTREECHSIADGTWWVYQNTCIHSCPIPYEQIDEPQRDCRETKNYHKTCEGTGPYFVDSLEDMAPCTHIDGPLSLVGLRESPLITEETLEANFGRITRISGYLRITDSSALRSLDFFKSLRVIEGREGDKYALYVERNPNLQRLWNFSNGFSLNITNGDVRFSNNPQLCYSEIEKFFNFTNVPNKDKLKELSRFSNGNMSSCNLDNPQVTKIKKN